jgi:hypothetical protein
MRDFIKEVEDRLNILMAWGEELNIEGGYDIHHTLHSEIVWLQKLLQDMKQDPRLGEGQLTKMVRELENERR